MNDKQFEELCNMFKDKSEVKKQVEKLSIISKFEFICIKFRSILNRFYKKYEFIILFILFISQFFMIKYNNNIICLIIQLIVVYVLVYIIFSKEL